MHQRNITAKKTLSYEIEEAISRLVSTQEFFAVLLFDLLKIKQVEDNDGIVKTLATDQKSLWINGKCWKEMLPNIDERVFAIAHEVVHTISEDCSRGQLYMERGVGPDLKPFNMKKWNYAIDYVNNAMLVEGRIGKLPTKFKVLYDPQIATSASLADDVYRALPDDFDKGRGGDPNGEGAGFDEHIECDPSQMPTKEEIQRAVENAKIAAKAAGNLPTWMERFCNRICEPQVTWQEHIRNMIFASAGRDEVSWARPNKRLLALAPHVYLPGKVACRAGTIVAYNDTSGSVSDDETSHFYAEMANIMEEVNPMRMFIGSCAMEASNPLEVESADDVRNYKSDVGGGTDMTAIFGKLEEFDIWPDTLVILTDGYTGFGDAPGYDVIWVITNKAITAPHGKTVHIDVTH